MGQDQSFRIEERKDGMTTIHSGHKEHARHI